VAEVSIGLVTADKVTPTVGDSTYYSVPRLAERNVNQRTFDIKFTKPSSATLDRAKVELIGSTGELMTMLDAPIGTSGASLIGSDTLRVRVTTGDRASTVPSDPPPTSSITYRFSISSTTNGVTSSVAKDSAPLSALWRMPSGFARYDAPPDDGSGNDWVSKGTHAWLNAHRALVTRIGDTSGEHAKDLGHPKGHDKGLDIDMYHFFTLPAGGASGGTNYRRLVDAVFASLAGNVDERDLVRQWVSASRTGLDRVLALSSVRIVFYSLGDVATKRVALPTGSNTSVQDDVALPKGWVQSLLTTGSVSGAATAQGPLAFDTGLGAWSPAATLRFDTVHDTHVHIGLQSSVNN
jgi:hypothetical protein